IQRYKNFLVSLLKVTDTSHPDYEQLLNAIKTFEEYSTIQDQKIADINNMQRVSQLAKKLGLDKLVQPHRRIIRESRCKVNGRKKSNRVYLFNDIIVFREPPGGITLRTRVSNVFSLLKANYVGSDQKMVNLI